MHCQLLMITKSRPECIGLVQSSLIQEGVQVPQRRAPARYNSTEQLNQIGPGRAGVVALQPAISLSLARSSPDLGWRRSGVALDQLRLVLCSSLFLGAPGWSVLVYAAGLLEHAR